VLFPQHKFAERYKRGQASVSEIVPACGKQAGYSGLVHRATGARVGLQSAVTEKGRYCEDNVPEKDWAMIEKWQWRRFIVAWKAYQFIFVILVFELERIHRGRRHGSGSCQEARRSSRRMAGATANPNALLRKRCLASFAYSLDLPVLE